MTTAGYSDIFLRNLLLFYVIIFVYKLFRISCMSINLINSQTFKLTSIGISKYLKMYIYNGHYNMKLLQNIIHSLLLVSKLFTLLNYTHKTKEINVNF